MRGCWKACLALAVALAAATLGPAAALAAYPGENGKIFFHSCGNPCANFDVYSVNPDGSGLVNVTEALTAPPGPPDNAFFPSVSADGKRLAFGVDSQATSEIWISEADGADPLQLTKDNLLDQEPAISPDGTRVIWNQWSPFPGYTDRDIWVMGADGSDQQLLFDGSGEDYYPEFTPDGQTIVLASETGDMDIRKTSSFPATPPSSTAIGVGEDDELLESEPSVSPDGTRVAFTQVAKSAPFGTPRDIYGVGIDGGPTTPLFATGANEIEPAYSPDGKSIVFSRDGVAVIGNADGSGSPVPLDLGAIEVSGAFDWAPRQAAPPVPPDDGGGAGLGSGPGAGGAQAQAPRPPTPRTRLGKHPRKRTVNHRARFEFSADSAGARFACRVDSRPFRACVSPFVRRLGLGRHVFRVRAVLADAGADPTPAKYRWRIVAAR